jgi:lipopolysaccharide/colanic/teichoic acid biosynthesis glycosyltransferase/glycosyltransferase involved in cell wall biosynthesis
MSMISVIIPVKDGEQTLDRCLQAVIQQQGHDIPYEVIIVDDGSSDDTVSIAQQYDVHVLSQPNGGPAAARNTGAKLARGDLLVFLDADCEPTPGWLAALLAALENPEIVAAKGVYRTRQQAPVARFVQQEYVHKYRRLKRQRYIDFIDTYSAIYRRNVFVQNGGFDTTFTGATAEDADLSFRLARKGYKMAFAPQAVVYHQHDENLKQYVQRKFGYGYWRAYIYNRMPEKAGGDSHTPRSLRWQIPLFGLGFAALLATLFVPQAWMAALACLLLFLFADRGLLLQIARQDRAILPLASVMLVVRAAALSSGLTLGFLNPPKPHKGVQVGPGLLSRALKRIFDLIGAVLGVVLSAPILALAAVVIKLDSPGPVFYRQERVGQGGRRFKILKLRSMRIEAELVPPEHNMANPLHGPLQTAPDDPLITRVGRVLRRWSLDELPQFWNVLKGDMSLVGPRPEVPWVVDQLNDWERERLAMKPGMTGPVQVSGRKLVDIDTRCQLETSFVKEYSLLKDLGILLRSILAVLSGKGAF